MRRVLSFVSIIGSLKPGWKLQGASAKTFAEAVLRDVRPVLMVVMAAVGLLLLIACANIGNLFLLRAVSRSREFSIRRALGARYVDLVGQLVLRVQSLQSREVHWESAAPRCAARSCLK